jgi:7,8-dihydroneopterin aldolase/epimerase/oxygenase
VDRIALTGLEVFAHHGALPHERELGQRFVIDVELGLDLAPAARSDALADTVDYGRLAARVAEAASEDPCDLIEALAGRIADVCLGDHRVQTVEVTVRKPHAPLPVLAQEVAVTVRRSRA